VFNDDGKATHHICVFSDASELVHSQELLRQQAAQDALTLLPNRFALNMAVEQMLERAKTELQRLSLVFVDLDNFKDVNDTLGHSAGDVVLQQVASRLSKGLQHTDVVGRYGGDEFVILLYGTRETGFIERTLDDLRASISAPLTVYDTALQIEASMGVASYPQDGTDAETLLRNADTALYRAKSEGRNRVRRFEAALARASADRLSLAGRLRNALHRSEFELLYQPKISVTAGCVVGVEALLRWHDPAHGVLGPSEFVRQAEDSGLIVPIGEWVIEQACRQAKQLFARFPDICVSLNVSPVQFARTDLPATVARALRSSRLRPDLLEIEITEGALMDPSMLPLLHAIREMGVTVAIDDFGVGYSSLAYIRHFMADTLKIDMSFIRGIGHSPRDEAIVKAILGLGHTLGMKVVGEGVETVMQSDFLTQHGCDEIQGYLYARPTSAAEIGQLIRTVNADLQAAYEAHG
jgi:diguanylate cyclase (GGDEF)-like protein